MVLSDSDSEIACEKGRDSGQKRRQSVFQSARTFEDWCSVRRKNSASSADAVSECASEADIHSEISGFESPHHLKAKWKYWRDKGQNPALQFVRKEDEEIETWTRCAESSACVSKAPSSETNPFDLNAFLKDEDEEIRVLVESSVPVYSDKQRRFKWGGCGIHTDLSLQPHLIRSGPSKGDLVLRCSSFWKTNEVTGKPLCFFHHKFPMKLFGQLPKGLQEEWADLKNVLLRNGRRH